MRGGVKNGKKKQEKEDELETRREGSLFFDSNIQKVDLEIEQLIENVNPEFDNYDIKIILNDLYEVIPAHIVDGVENERVLYHAFNEFIINNYHRIVEDGIGELEKNDYNKFFNDDIVLGYVLEKTHLRKFILRLITNYHNRLINFEGML